MATAPDPDLEGFMSAAMFTAESGFFAAARLRERLLGALEPEPALPAKAGVEGEQPENDVAGKAPNQGRHRGLRPARPAPGTREQQLALQTERARRREAARRSQGTSGRRA
jgi:hypothetical protein